jgi:hypothetical protein
MFLAPRKKRFKKKTILELAPGTAESELIPMKLSVGAQIRYLRSIEISLGNLIYSID